MTDLRIVPSGHPSSGLTATGVGKTFRKRPVVRNVSINVRRGEAVGLLGPNGAGKTTTFYMIVGLVRPDTGAILLDGHDITDQPMYRRARLGIGYLPQEASVFRGLNVEQNVMAALEVVEPDRDRREQMLEELLAICAAPRRWRSPAANAGGWKSPARSPPSPATSCSMNRWPGSTRLRWAKSATWSPTSKIAASAC